jgi:anti-sigma B factor antagonist
MQNYARRVEEPFDTNRQPTGAPQVIKRSEFEIKTEENADGVRVLVAGDLDLATVPELEAELERVLAGGGGARRVTLDLRELTFADSSGVRLLIATNDQAREGGWTLEIVRPPDEAFMVFRISGADSDLPFVDG